MNRFLCLVFSILFVSCTIHRKIQITPKSESELLDFYHSKEVNGFLVVKDFNSFKTLNDGNRITIPQNIVFDPNGYEIEHFNEKLCANHTLEFLKTYNSITDVNLTNYHISDYLSNFRILNDSVSIQNIIDTKDIRVFVNSATFGEKPNVNKEGLNIYKLYKDKFKVYVINLDPGAWNSN